MIDQYNNDIPDDLVLMPHLYIQKNGVHDKLSLSETDIKLISMTDWYDVIVHLGDNEYCTLLCISAKAINYLSEISPYGEIQKIMKIDDPLKRCNVIDGFYHT